MASRHNLFRVFYGLGFTPWDGHAHSKRLRELIEGTVDTPALPPEAALDVGCGTGDSSVYLAQHGWDVTGVDFVPKALDKARAAFDAASEGWWFDAGDRHGVLHVKVGPQTLAAGFRVAIEL